MHVRFICKYFIWYIILILFFSRDEKFIVYNGKQSDGMSYSDPMIYAMMNVYCDESDLSTLISLSNEVLIHFQILSIHTKMVFKLEYQPYGKNVITISCIENFYIVKDRNNHCVLFFFVPL